jgi:4-diphosphocytidyl-2-C-methyl-D-erythritol kinase
VRGPTRGGRRGGDNLVLKARARWPSASRLAARPFRLDKQLPVAAGLGGGSSDAAAALRLLARRECSCPDDADCAAARATGADVPVCLDPRPRMMRGIGEILSGRSMLPTCRRCWSIPASRFRPGTCFARLRRLRSSAPQADDFIADRYRRARCAALRARRNDLEAPAIALQPVIADVLAALRAPPCLLRACRVGCDLLRSVRIARTREARRSAAGAPSGWWVRRRRFG